MTFNDYAVECSLYEYSNEHFELMKECSEIALGERWIKNQLVLSESAEDLGISEDATITESFLMESADENSLQAMYEKTEAKKASIWSKFVAWIKRGLSTIGKWFLRLAGENYDDLTAQLREMAGKNEKLEYELQQIKGKLDRAGVHIKVANGKISDLQKKVREKDATIKGKDEVIDKVKKERDDKEKALMSSNKKISDLQKSNAEKDAEIKRQQDQNTKLGNDVSNAWSIIEQKNKEILELAKKSARLNVIVDKLPSACDPVVLCKVMTEMGALIKKGYESNGTMIKANSVRQITKKLDDAIDEQRSGNMHISISTNEFKNCGNEMNKLLEGLNSMQASTESSFDSEVGSLISQAMVKINKAQADTMKMVQPLIAARNSIYGLGKAAGKKEAKKAAEGK